MDRDYGANYANLYRTHWWWRARERAILDALRHLKLESRARILDVGCGDALFFDKLSSFGQVEGVEPDEALVSRDNPYRERIYISQFDSSFRPEKQYDLVLMLDVLEHLQDPAEALACVKRLLLPGGYFLATVPAFQALWTKHDELNHHYRRYTRKTFLQEATGAGLVVERCEYLFKSLFPMKLAARFVEGCVSSEPTSPKAPPKLINNFLYRLMVAEQKTLGGLDVPFGSSLLAICR